ncbi:MAG: AAA family ATPase [Chlamydiae bacterium]|nr:AAA family ATPase [Chlamydiota bacterium]
MLQELVSIHQEVMTSIVRHFKRYLYPKIHWSTKGLCLLGDRGVGKTTMMCQHLLDTYTSSDRALYLSADHVIVLSLGLFRIAREFFDEGGEALYIDEVHKYPNWSLEIKNILDTYKKKQVIFSGSSSLDLHKSKGDLSRRVVYYRLQGLSFREYLLLAKKIEVPIFSIEEILQDHVKLASFFESFPVLSCFKEYLHYGYYPFFSEGVEDYYMKLNNVIEKVLFEDVAVIYNLKQSTLPVLKRILWLAATSDGLIPNIDKMSKNLGVSREMIYSSLEHLTHAGLLREVRPFGKGNTLARKPAKLYLHNTNLLYAIHGSLQMEAPLGAARESFFVNQVEMSHKLTLHNKGDFFLEDRWVVEIGGRNKDDEQIRGEQDAYLVIDNIKIGFGKKIPLYLFGCLY